MLQKAGYKANKCFCLQTKIIKVYHNYSLPWASLLSSNKVLVLPSCMDFRFRDVAIGPAGSL